MPEIPPPTTSTSKCSLVMGRDVSRGPFSDTPAAKPPSTSGASASRTRGGRRAPRLAFLLNPTLTLPDGPGGLLDDGRVARLRLRGLPVSRLRAGTAAPATGAQGPRAADRLVHHRRLQRGGVHRRPAAEHARPQTGRASRRA